MLSLIGIVIVVVGFMARLNPLLVVTVAVRLAVVFLLVVLVGLLRACRRRGWRCRCRRHCRVCGAGVAFHVQEAGGAWCQATVGLRLRLRC